MTRRALILIYGLALIVALAASLPLRLALEWSGAETLGLSAERVQGPFWAGRVTGARVGALPLGDLQVSINPLALMLAGDDAGRLAAVRVRDASGEAIPLDGLAAR